MGVTGARAGPSDPAAPGPRSPTELISDYSQFDFAGFWTGRELVSELERRIVGRALGGERHRVLEVGAGFGRLTEAVASRAREYVGLDLDATALRKGLARPVPSRRLAVRANLLHLPFVAGAFSDAVLIRVYHHLADPAAAATEIHRVLRGGGHAVVSYGPKPTLGTLEEDVRRALRGDRRGWFTFSREPVVSVLHRGFPIFVPSVAHFESVWTAAGFEPVKSWGTGPESPLRVVPIDSAVALGGLFPRSPLFSTRFALLRSSDGGPGVVPPLESAIACPRCSTPLPDVVFEGTWSRTCARCGFELSFEAGILDAAYLPANATIVRPRRAL